QRGDTDPRAVKKDLVTRIVADLHGSDAATRAAEEYERYAELRRGGTQAELPSNLREVVLSMPPEGIRLAAVLVQAGLATSNGEAKRLLKQRGVRLRQEVVTDDGALIRPGETDGVLLQVGQKPPVLLREGE
ncbi:MAG: S4 domain-containing protein, partial [Chloroflexota bacterium]|nr:S4 domain-containing protein [Chloroflexota bacterium]